MDVDYRPVRPALRHSDGAFPAFDAELIRHGLGEAVLSARLAAAYEAKPRIPPTTIGKSHD